MLTARDIAGFGSDLMRGAPMPTAELCELSEKTLTSAVDGGTRVDESAGRINNVSLCGFRSVNGRDYPAEVLKRYYRKYEGVKVFFDHASGGGERSFRDWVGVVKNARLGAGGRPRGDLHLFTSDPHVPKLMQAARTTPESFGMSHVVDARTYPGPGGRDIVESIERCYSVDIVLDPATNAGGLFSERVARPRPSTTETAGQFVARAAATLGDRRHRLRVARCLTESAAVDRVLARPADAVDLNGLKGPDRAWASFLVTLAGCHVGVTSGTLTVKEAARRLLASAPGNDLDPDGGKAAHTRKAARLVEAGGLWDDGPAPDVTVTNPWLSVDAARVREARRKLDANPWLERDPAAPKPVREARPARKPVAAGAAAWQ